MFGTVILDAYTKDQTAEVAAAIDDLCCPTDNYGWASAGIYSFWDYNTHEVLYIGLASDLAVRFEQHNGLRSMPEDGCKTNQITEYFQCHEKLGYTIFVQSPLSQPVVHRNRQLFERIATEDNVPIQNYANKQGIDDIKKVEGILIEAYNMHYGRFPAWNKVGGSVAGQGNVLENNINIVKSFGDPKAYEVNPIVSRSTIRELSNNPTYEMYELYLHAVRMYILLFGMEYQDALAFANLGDKYSIYQKICNAGYLSKQLIL